MIWVVGGLERLIAVDGALETRIWTLLGCVRSGRRQHSRTLSGRRADAIFSGASPFSGDDRLSGIHGVLVGWGAVAKVVAILYPLLILLVLHHIVFEGSGARGHLQVRADVGRRIEGAVLHGHVAAQQPICPKES